MIELHPDGELWLSTPEGQRLRVDGPGALLLDAGGRPVARGAGGE